MAAFVSKNAVVVSDESLKEICITSETNRGARMVVTRTRGTCLYRTSPQTGTPRVRLSGLDRVHQIVFERWDPAREGWSEKHRALMEETVEGMGGLESITQVILMAGIRSLRGDLSKRSSGYNQEPRMRDTARAIVEVVQKLRETCPNAEVCYLGAGRLYENVPDWLVQGYRSRYTVKQVNVSAGTVVEEVAKYFRTVMAEYPDHLIGDLGPFKWFAKDLFQGFNEPAFFLPTGNRVSVHGARYLGRLMRFALLDMKEEFFGMFVSGVQETRYLEWFHELNPRFGRGPPDWEAVTEERSERGWSRYVPVGVGTEQPEQGCSRQ
jgi:hypothetical protein